MNRRNRRSESIKTVSARQGRAILALAVCVLVLAPLPALAQDAPDDSAAQAQDVEMPREVRVLVQRGLAALGFDPGPADGLFGPKTRAAIWDWQAAKELDTTGYLTLIEAEALAAVGAEASETLDMEVQGGAGQPAAGTEAETTTAPSKSRNEVLYFPTCGTDDARPEGCWLALAAPADCVLWWPGSSGMRVTWSGVCDDTLRASGRGILKWEDVSASGELVGGMLHGHWVLRLDDTVFQGPYVDGVRHGHWMKRHRFEYDGSLHGWDEEGPYVNGQMHGRWVTRFLDGAIEVEVQEYRHGELVP